MKVKTYKVIRSSRVIASVGASMACEGLKPSVQAQRVGKLYLEGEIGGEEAIARIKKQHASKFGK